jgi:RNA polymerase sigma factor (sigma-70 family)
LGAVPSRGRAVRVEGAPAPEADLTRALYEQYANQIFRYCLHQLGSREEAEDAVQSTFLNAFRGIKRGIVPELESAWLFKIAHNVCLSRRRSTWRRGRVESPADFEVVEELMPAPSRRADELMGLQDVLEEMPENQRRAILLREWQGLSYREIADELELSQAAVETLIFRARRALAAGLEQPPEPKRRLVRGADLGNVLAGLKTLLLGGGAAVKVAATVAVVSATTVVAAAPVQQHQQKAHAPARHVPAASASLPAQSGTATSVVSSAGPAASFPGVTPKQRHLRVRAAAPIVPFAVSGGHSEIAPEPSAPAPADPPPPASAASAPAPADPPPPAPAASPPAPATPAPASAPPAAPAASAPATTSDKGSNSSDKGAASEAPSSSSDAKGKDTQSGSVAPITPPPSTPSGRDAAQSKQLVPIVPTSITQVVPAAPIATTTNGSAGNDASSAPAPKLPPGLVKNGTVTLPVTPVTPIATTPQTTTPAATTPVTTAPAPTQPSSSSGASKGSDNGRPNDSNRRSSAPAPVVALPATVIQPVPPAATNSVIVQPAGNGK